MNDKKMKSVATLFLSFQVTSKMAFMYCFFTGVLIHLHISVRNQVNSSLLVSFNFSTLWFWFLKSFVWYQLIISVCRIFFWILAYLVSFNCTIRNSVKMHHCGYCASLTCACNTVNINSPPQSISWIRCSINNTYSYAALRRAL